MQQDGGASAKQQIVERIKQSTNILVTVNSNPSVDALSAALALTLMLTKLDKHATAVFSGVIPPAIKFLQPDKTFEHNVDSLRDFIIALDKEKADRLRYKVENDVVKVFITPYKTTITEKDLQFSQGDFNVDLIVALGVEKREELDKAITAHGRILHDATVATINAANQKSSLGAVDWQEGAASSLCEMLMSLSEALQAGLLDQQISTALLTGIVAATERFSNHHTTPRVMTMSAQLMAAGANQQLIATNLGTAAIAANKAASSPAEGSTKVAATEGKGVANGEMHIRHDEGLPKPRMQPPTPAPSQQAELSKELEIAPPAAQAFNELKQALEIETKNPVKSEPTSFENPLNKVQAKQPERQEENEEAYLNKKPSWMGRNIEPPTLGGSLSATAEEALEDKMHQEEDQRNHKLLSHDQPKNKTNPKPHRLQQKPQNTPTAPPTPPPAPMSALAQPTPEQPAASNPQIMDSVPLQTEPTLEQIEKQAKSGDTANAAPIPPADLDAARQAVNDALAAGPFTPIGNRMESIGAQDFPQSTSAPFHQAPPQPSVTPTGELTSGVPTLPPLQPELTPQPSIAPAASGLPTPPVPPLPDFNTLPPTPPVLPQLPPLPENPLDQSQPSTSQPQSPQQPADPGQFKIPEQ